MKLTCSGFCLLVLCAFFARPSVAQDSNPVAVRFRTLGWETSRSDLYIFQSGKDEAVVIQEDVRSAFCPYKGPALITFYQVKTGPDGKIQKVFVAQASLERAGPWPLLIFSGDPTRPNACRIQVIPDDLQSFPAGSYEIVDYSDTPMSGAIGSQAFILQPQEIRIIRSRPAGNSTALYASISQEGKAGKTLIYGNNWGYQPDIRTILFIKPSHNTTSGVAAHRIIESTVFPPEPKRP